MSQHVAFFSDLHLPSEANSKNEQLLISYLKNLRKNHYTDLVFLGDIFDLMVGPFDFWKERHKNFFEEISAWTQNERQVYWVQGNHDFYLEDLLDQLGVQCSDNDIDISFDGKRLYLAHGDLVDEKYLKWRNQTRSPAFRALLSSIPEKIAEKLIVRIGNKLSQKSRKKTQRPHPNEIEKIQSLYRSFSSEKWGHGFNGVCLGHSHIDDLHIEKEHFYLNLGTWLDGSPRCALWSPSEYDYPKVEKINL